MIQDQAREVACVDPVFAGREGDRYPLARTGSDASVPWIRFERFSKRVDVEHESRRNSRVVDEPDPLLRLAILARADHD